MARKWRDAGGARAASIRVPARIKKTVGRCKALGDGSLLAVVADGMGGHAGGAAASKLAVEAFVHALEQGGGLADGLHDANAAVGKGAAAKPELAGMGATLVAAQVRGDEVRWISVGDSPLFLVSAGQARAAERRPFDGAADRRHGRARAADGGRGRASSGTAHAARGRHGRPADPDRQGQPQARPGRRGCCCAATACSR